MTSQSRSALAVAAATLLGTALIPAGSRDVRDLRIFLLILVMIMAALATLGKEPAERTTRLYRPDQPHQAAFWIGLLVFAWSLLRALDLNMASQAVLFVFGITVAGSAALAVGRGLFGNAAFLVFLGAYLVVALGVLAATRDSLPNIDVVQFQQDASDALLRGENPYAMRFPDIYPPVFSERFYGPGVSVDGQLQFGYPYLPLSLLVIAPFEALLGDFRIAHVLALVGSALIISRIRPSGRSRWLATLFLLVSPGFYVIEFGWVEPLLILAAALVVLGASRNSEATPYLAGGLLGLKQYSPLLLPASLLLLDRPWRFRSVVGLFAKAGLIVAVTVLPFFLWNPGEFTWSVVELQFEQPFRSDSISLMATWARVFEQPPRIVTSLVPLVVVAAASVAIWRRTPAGPQGFALAAGFTLLVAFGFSKQAFTNYYILVIGLLFLGAAAGDEGRDDEEDKRDVRDGRALRTS